jgi:uncharacterized protein YyaL (SSP411 family)
MLTNDSFHGRAGRANHLKGQSSPYLLQHLYNPVDWYPWGEEALEKARTENKPILVSIGYSACHWCHVMEKESFEDPAVAAIMNQHFVCIKVDREERPDIDHVYMAAVQMLTRQGGWPLNCFALPDTRPFWGGTYFTKAQWISVLERVAELFATRYNDLAGQAEQITTGIATSGFVETGDGRWKPDAADAHKVFRNIMNYMDTREGGTLHAPKFPLPVNLQFLLQYYHHTHDAAALQQVELSLKKMAMGGIYDQAGGGFARYSTDENWKVPHFEKMLYDNAQLVSLYSDAWKVTGNPLYQRIVYETLEFINRELRAPSGCFYSALDADSEGEEGKYYVWTEAEIDMLLGNDSSLIREYYQVGKKGFWEHGNNILLTPRDEEEFARSHAIPLEQFMEILKRSKEKLLTARSLRERPLTDTKLLVSWNALMIKALSDAYAAFGDPGLLAEAEKAAGYLATHNLTAENLLYRTNTGRSRPIQGFLDDYALLIDAFIRLFEVSMETDYLLKAEALAGFAIQHFAARGSHLFRFSSGLEDKLAAEHFETYDGVIPSSNSTMAINLLRLGELFGNHEWIEHSLKMLTDMESRLASHGISHAGWGQLLLLHVYGCHTLVVTGPGAASNLRYLCSKYLPGVVLAGSEEKKHDIPIFANRYRDGQGLFFVCTGGVCRLPVFTVEEAVDQLK